MPKLVKVDHNPFEGGPKLVPVEGNPFEGGGVEKPKTDWRNIASSIYTPVLEGTGAMVGAAVAAPTGPVGMVAGGTGGYVAGKNAAEGVDDLLGIGDKKTVVEELKDLPSEIKTGAEAELLGMNIGAGFVGVFRGGKWLFQKAPKFAKDTSKKVTRVFSKEGHQKDAGEILQAHTSYGPVYARNNHQAEQLEKEIPGLKFRRGAKTEDPKRIRLEQQRGARNPELAVEYTDEIRSNNEALKTYYQTKFGGKEGADDLVGEITRQHNTYQMSAETAKREAVDLVNRMGLTDNAKTGEELLSAIQEAKGTARAKASILYEAVGDVQLQVKALADDFEKIMGKSHKFEGDDAFPTVIKQYLGEFKEGVKEISLKDLRGLRSDLLDTLRSRAAQENPALARRAVQAVEAVEGAMTKAGGKHKLLKEANKYYFSSYVEVFRHRGVGEILTRGKKGEMTRLRVAEIPAEMWKGKLGYLVDDVVKAIGKDSTANMMRQYAKHDLAETVTKTGEIDKKLFSQWFQKNSKLLKKLGIEKEFDSVKKVQGIAEGAAKTADEYANEVATYTLGMAPDKIIPKIISGKNPPLQMANVVKAAKGNKSAVKGLQNAFADHFISSVRSMSKRADDPTLRANAIESFMAKNEKVMQVLYKDAPEKYRALKMMQRTYRVFMRNSKGYAGVGSDTTTKLAGFKLPGFLDRKVFIARMVLDKAQGYRQQAVEELIDRALVDGDFAELLMSKAKGPADLAKKYNAFDEYVKRHRNFGKRVDQQQKAAILGAGVAATETGEE